MKLLLIDGNSIINRAFYGIRILTAPDGTSTNALLGFFNTYLKVTAEEKPDGVCVCFDVHAPTFRHKLYDAYKAGRHATPPELLEQMPILRELLDLLGIPRLELAGFEADDLLGTLSQRCEEAGQQAVILTGDRDSLQLVGEHTKVKLASTKAGQALTEDYDPLRILLDYGVTPHQLIDVKALMGDKSDNIPGVPGIGEKTASALIARCGDLDTLYKDVPGLGLTPSVTKKLTEGKESAYKSRVLAEIDRHVPVEADIFAMTPAMRDVSAAYDRFASLSLFSLIDRLGLKKEEKKAVANLSVPTQEKMPEDYVPAGETAFYLSPDGLAVADGERHYTALEREEGYESLLRVYFESEQPKTTHDLKSALSLLLERGIEAKGQFFDTLTASSLLGGEQALASLAARYFGITSVTGKEAPVILALTKELRPLMKPYERLYEGIELPLSRVIAGMEYEGFLLDTAALADYGEGLALIAADDEKRIYEIAGEKFNINSPKQLGGILFEKLGLPVIKKTKSGYSTDADVLNKLKEKNEIIGLILEYRSLTKLKSTYADGLPKGISPRDGRVHSTFYQTGAITGRISSSEPNLQNIPVRTPLGRELRKMFTAAPGRLLVDADYSQIELRLLAHISEDESLIRAFKEGVDIHALTASQVFGVPLTAVTGEMRSRAKAVNFGIIYGISDFALAEDIGVTRREAKAYIERYLDSYPGVRRYMKEIVERARENGYVETLFGRRRYIPDIKAKNFNLRSAAERVALNAPIQGTAADVIKLAMVKLHERLEKDFPGSKLILQIHDELIVETPENMAEAVREAVVEVMEHTVDCRVTLEADAGIGKTWYQAKK